MNRIVAYLEKPMSAVGVVVRLIIAFVVFVAAAAFCLQALDARAQVTAAQRDRSSLQDAAGGVIAEVFSVDSRTWSGDRRTAQALVAPPLAVSAQRALSGPPPSGTASVSWVPQNVAVSWADDRAGEVLAVFRVTVTARGGRTDSRLKSVQCSFVRSGDRWLLSGLEELQ